MKFAYKKIPIIRNLTLGDIVFVYRPIIPVQIKHKSKEIKYEALIDSGADQCIFHSEIAEIIGIPWREGKKCNFGGIGGKVFKGFASPINLVVGGNEIKTKTIFSSEIPNSSYAILGQSGFFKFFRIRFVFQKKTIEITPEQRL